MQYRLLPIILLLIMPLSAKAQITTDGTLEHRGALACPDYQIGADLGQQHGGNIFHSFHDFNLNRYEGGSDKSCHAPR
ncbi:MAG TPA: hypothetical protein EYP59_06240, partial [Thiotrichaceae bacterium]|nr:hypothetical protein [Thiotrichaceae bacterium]